MARMTRVKCLHKVFMFFFFKKKIVLRLYVFLIWTLESEEGVLDLCSNLYYLYYLSVFDQKYFSMYRFRLRF